MGTQFTSSLTKAQTTRVISGIRTAFATAAPARKPDKREPAAKAPAEPAPPAKPEKAIELKVTALSAAQKRQLGDVAVKQVMRVAEEREFSAKFRESDLFIDVLKWLKSLVNDAKFNSFRGMIERYQLEGRPFPGPALNSALKEIGNRELEDPFRVAITSAAKSVVADAARRSFLDQDQGTAAEKFGRGLASFEVRELVRQYVGSFFGEFVERMLSRSDPEHAEPLVEPARVLAKKSAERMARAATKAIEKAGALTDAERIREIVARELAKRYETKPA